MRQFLSIDYHRRPLSASPPRISTHAGRSNHRRGRSGHRHREGTRQRGDGLRVQGPLPQGRPRPRPEGHRLRPGRQRAGPRPLRARGQDPQAAQAPEHHPPLRHRAVPQDPLLRHGIRRGGIARQAVRAARQAAVGGHRHLRQAALRGPAARPREGDRPPRPEAAEHHDRQGRHPEADRLRHRQGRGFDRANRGEQHHRHGGLHVAGTVPWGEDARPQIGPVFPRRRLLRTRHRAASRS